MEDIAKVISDNNLGISNTEAHIISNTDQEICNANLDNTTNNNLDESKTISEISNINPDIIKNTNLESTSKPNPGVNKTNSKISHTNQEISSCTNFTHSRSFKKVWEPKLLESQVSKEETEHALFEFCKVDENKACVKYLLKHVKLSGLRLSDPRLQPLMTYLESVNDQDDLNNLKLDIASFSKSLESCSTLIHQAINKQLVIPDFQEFTNVINNIFNDCKEHTEGEKADYIPQLARANPDHWGVSICTVDGQRLSLGDTKEQFTIQSTSKAITYAMLLDYLGHETVHKYEGCEPSGRIFNEIVLDYNNKPHNPMVNSGAIMSAALILQLVKPELNRADKYDMVMDFFKKMAGNEYIGFDNAVFMSEKENADRNTALAFFMRENKCFPECVAMCDINSILEFYYQLCSLKATCESLSVVASTLANGGKCPITGEQVVKSSEVRHVLSLMYSCGMYNYSGQFAFNVGLPAKSGVSGVVMLVVPNVMGAVTFSPPLDKVGNSVRGVQFCEKLVKQYSFHVFDSVDRSHDREDPTQQEDMMINMETSQILIAATKGDLYALKKAHAANVDMNLCDYNMRTAMHQAAMGGHAACVKYLVRECRARVGDKDVWGITPVEEAVRAGHQDIVDILQQYEQHQGGDMGSIGIEE